MAKLVVSIEKDPFSNIYHYLPGLQIEIIVYDFTITIKVVNVWTLEKLFCISLKFQAVCKLNMYCAVKCPKHSDGMMKSVDQDREQSLHRYV